MDFKYVKRILKHELDDAYEDMNINEVDFLSTLLDCVEAQEALVHCKDCVSWGGNIAGETDNVKCCNLAGYMIGKNGFCVYGQKGKENGSR